MILIALGANLPSAAGSPAETLTAALGAMAARNIRVLKVSSYYRSPAWPDPADPPYVNAVALVQSMHGPAALLQALHGIEEEFGRERSRPNAPRTLDLDVIDYDGRIEPGPPVLPHPRAGARAFVLKPLADVAPAWIHPTARKSVTELLAALPQQSADAVMRLTG